MRRSSIAAIAFSAVLTACAQAVAPVPAPVPEAAAPPAEARQAGQPARPLPHPVTPPAEFLAAVASGTRTLQGVPGSSYWQNWSEYDLDVRLLTEARRVEGQGTIRYQNRSPDALEVLVVDLAQNLHAPGVQRGEPAEVTGGVELGRISVNGTTLAEGGETGPRYMVDGTKLVLIPGSPVQPGGTAGIEIEWAFDVPQAGAGARMGYSRDDLYYIAYWYPQMAVYDDIGGWHPDQFLSTSEFYSGFGDYRVSVELPADWLVRATGELQDPASVLDPQVLDRLRLAEQSDTTVRVFDPTVHSRGTRAGAQTLRWTFSADSVRDFAFSAHRDSHWDAGRTPVGDRDGDGAVDHARIEAIYRPAAPLWSEMVDYAQHSIDFLSRFTGFSYPWPHMTAVEGADIIGGGMEFPMMTLMGDYNERGDTALYNVTAHELAHMWVPMIVSTDERRYSWIDEGMTTFAENQARAEYFPGGDHEAEDRENYLQVARAGLEGEMMRHSAYHYPGPAFVAASYWKPATVLVALRGVLGEETFEQAYREFIDRWAFKHPQPWDLWNTFENVSGEDLDWFWSAWYHETWTMDQAIASVTPTEEGTRIVIEDRGLAPMPVHLAITRENGETRRIEVPVDAWLSGATQTAVMAPDGEPIVRVEIDPDEAFPDVDRDNNVWTR